MKYFYPKSILFFCLLWSGSVVFSMASTSTQSVDAKQVLWYCPSEKLDAKTYGGFSRDLFGDLAQQLTDIGYCLRYYSAADSFASTPKGQNNLCLQIHINDSSVNHASDNNEEKNLMADLCRLSEFTKAKTGPSLNRQLLSLIYNAGDSATMRSIFVKKIIENLRTQYICNVVITSDPLGVQVMAVQGGLADVTPLEWVVPVGSLHVQCSKKKYVTLEKDLMLPEPGAHTYFLQMKKRQFYNSKYFYPAIIMLATSVVSYYYKTYYYDRYNRLGELELRNDPDSFGSNFQKAKNFEGASVAALVVCGFFTGLTFWF